MFCSFGKEAGKLQIEHLTEDFKMDPTHNVGTFLRLLKWFSEAQILYPTIGNDKEVGYLFFGSCKNHILWNYDFKPFEEDINNMNKIDTSISIHTLKLKARSSYPKKENLARRMKSQKPRSQKTIVLGRLMLKKKRV